LEARAGQAHDGLQAASPNFIELNETRPLTSKKIILFKKKKPKIQNTNINHSRSMGY
jgi:hypothetical protein